ncbi:TetR/AcrR family transcriptional regulator [Lactobacillaceae bacterium Melli_B3]
MYNSKIQIIGAFLALVNRKPLFKITISDIIDESGISRGTFYRCFNSRSDIVKQYEMIINHQIVHAFIIKYRKLGRTNLSPQEFINLFADVTIPIVYHNRDYIRILHGSIIGEVWHDHLERHYVRLMRKLYPNNTLVDIEVFVKAINLAISLWITKDIPVEKQQYHAIFNQFFSSRLLDVFEQ